MPVMRANDKNVPEKLKGVFGYGSVWTWTALDANSKLMISWTVGLRDAGYAAEHMMDVAARLAFKLYHYRLLGEYNLPSMR